jgi:hypothetical protein
LLNQIDRFSNLPPVSIFKKPPDTGLYPFIIPEATDPAGLNHIDFYKNFCFLLFQEILLVKFLKETSNKIFQVLKV